MFQAYNNYLDACVLLEFYLLYVCIKYGRSFF